MVATPSRLTPAGDAKRTTENATAGVVGAVSGAVVMLYMRGCKGGVASKNAPKWCAAL